jgi:hypothetical protein
MATFLQVLPPKRCMQFYPMHATCHSHFILFYLNIRILFVEEYKLSNLLLYHLPFSSDILVRALFSNTFNLCSSLNDIHITLTCKWKLDSTLCPIIEHLEFHLHRHPLYKQGLCQAPCDSHPVNNPLQLEGRGSNCHAIQHPASQASFMPCLDRAAASTVKPGTDNCHEMELHVLSDSWVWVNKHSSSKMTSLILWPGEI